MLALLLLLFNVSGRPNGLALLALVEKPKALELTFLLVARAGVFDLLFMVVMGRPNGFDWLLVELSGRPNGLLFTARDKLQKKETTQIIVMSYYSVATS